MKKGGWGKLDGENVVSNSLGHCLGYPVPTLNSFSPNRKDRVDRDPPAG